jgi:transcriptional regulator with AAA-type ATPase domain
MVFARRSRGGFRGNQLMRDAGSQGTTLTSPRRPSPPDLPGHLFVKWLFPRPTDPALSLTLPVGEQRVIGRDESCGVRLQDPDVSRRHAQLEHTGAAILLSDLGSRNGTWVNGVSMKVARLELGDVVRMGGCVGFVTPHPEQVTELAPGLLAGPLLRLELEGARRAASSDLPIILEGETGTGKEVVARSIHAWSGRQGPYLAINCAALPEALAEAELFGYRRGAFTGADRSSLGLFRSAHGGTLLLDEVSDLPLVLQAKLLRVLEQREVQALGEATPVAIDTRVIVATQEPLREVVARRNFRQDLFARLDGISVRLPPLRQRRGDVPALFTRVLAQQSAGRAPALEADFIERLCLHDWPFNVREVALLAKRLAVLCADQSSLTARDLPPAMCGRESVRVGGAREGREHQASTPSAAVDPRAAPAADRGEEPIELPALMGALRASGGNVAQAAIVLGISRQRAYRLMQGQAVDLDALRESLQREEP